MTLSRDASASPSNWWWNSIGRRFILYIFLFSSLVTLCSTAIQLYYEYKRDIRAIDASLAQIEKSYLKSLGEGLWTFNERGLRVQLQGILDLPDVEYVEIRKEGASYLSVGAPVRGGAIRGEFAIPYSHRGQELQLGVLMVTVGLEGVYARLWDRVVVILITQGIKTFFVSSFIFFLFHAMVGRHLKTMAAYAGSLTIDRLAEPLTVPRSSKCAGKDEIGLVVKAINQMRQTLLEDIELNRQGERTVQMLSESAAGLTGQKLFDAIVRDLCEFLGCECAILGRLDKEADTVSVLAMEVDGKAVSGYSYALHGTPCEDVDRKGYCVFPEQVAALYPEDRDLADMGAEGYVGVPVVGRDKESLGILCGISRTPLVPPPRTKDVMHILQARVAAELERMAVDEERERMEILLRQAQKMEAIGTLAGGIAHDFNNILTPIIGYTEMAQLEMSEQERKAWAVDEVLRAAQRAKDLVQQILTFSRQREQEYVSIALQPIIKESLKLLRASLPATIEIRVDVDAACGPVLADPTQIQQVVMNLCTNAFHAMEEKGGTLDVSLRQVAIDAGQEFLHDPLPVGQYLRLVVSDTGHGMEKGMLERIFEPYYTTKAQGKGTGLGLALVHGIVKAHRGRIDVYSEPGEGAVFKVYLPVAVAHAQAGEKPADTLAEALPRGNESILVVDDEEAIVRLSVNMLQQLGYSVVGLRDSREAFRLFASNPRGFDLVITDLTMPGMTGDELACRLMEIRPDLPVVLCTGFSARMTTEKGESLGIRALAAKPFDRHDMALLIRKVLDGEGFVGGDFQESRAV
ncbi:MAG: ATP-binding protein [Thermodesulfobacteriota bacterium]